MEFKKQIALNSFYRLVDDNLAYAKFHRSPKLHFKGTQLGKIYVANNLIGL